jgi:uncharacterized protein YjbJ (UPF0337 family)
MTSQEGAATMDKLKGRIKQGVGKANEKTALNNKDRLRGKLQQGEGKVQEAFGKAKEKFRKAA